MTNEKASQESIQNLNMSLPCRSTHHRKPPQVWWKAHTALLKTLSDISLCYKQATKGEEGESWKVSFEMDSLYIKTWVLGPSSKARSVLSNKWILRKKDSVTPDGSTYVKFNARLVPRGFQQLEKIDSQETFASTVKFNTLLWFLEIVATENLELHQMDVKTGFLNGNLSEDVFMDQPERFVDCDFSDHVCKMLKALNGLKQAPRQ